MSLKNYQYSLTTLEYWKGVWITCVVWTEPHLSLWLHRIEKKPLFRYSLILKPYCKLLYEQDNWRVIPVSKHGCQSRTQSLPKLILRTRILPLRFTRHCLVLDYKRTRTDLNDLPCHYLFIHEYRKHSCVGHYLLSWNDSLWLFHRSVMMIDGDRWLFFTDGNISKWHHCNDRAAYDRYQTRNRML